MKTKQLPLPLDGVPDLRKAGRRICTCDCAECKKGFHCGLGIPDKDGEETQCDFEPSIGVRR